VAYQARRANKFDLQKIVYGTLRTEYQLPAQMAIRAISKAVEAYKRDKSVCEKGVVEWRYEPKTVSQ
jgi:hypothetical protein